MGYTVTIQQVGPQWIAAARGSAEPGEVSRTMLGLLGKVWPFVKTSGIKTDGQNVAIYYKDHTIEAGARVLAKFEGDGEVSCVATPAGWPRWWFIRVLMKSWVKRTTRFGIGARRTDASLRARTGK